MALSLLQKQATCVKSNQRATERQRDIFQAHTMSRYLIVALSKMCAKALKWATTRQCPFQDSIALRLYHLSQWPVKGFSILQCRQ